MKRFLKQSLILGVGLGVGAWLYEPTRRPIQQWLNRFQATQKTREAELIAALLKNPDQQ